MGIIKWLKGKKTYIIATSSMIAALAAYVSGTMLLSEMIKIWVGAILTMTVRAGIAKGPSNQE